VQGLKEPAFITICWIQNVQCIFSDAPANSIISQKPLKDQTKTNFN